MTGSSTWRQVWQAFVQGFRDAKLSERQKAAAMLVGAMIGVGTFSALA